MVYTLSSDEHKIEWGLSDKDRIAQNVLNIIRTKATEVPFMREMGLNYDYIDSDIGFIRGNLRNDITDLINEYEPRANVLSVDFEKSDTDNNITIKVEVEV